MKTFSQITAEGLGLSDKPDYVSVKALTTLIKKENMVYMVNKETSVDLYMLFFRLL